MADKFELLRPDVLEVLDHLSDPERAVCRPLVKGKAAGKLDLIYQLYPPRAIHRSSIPACYTFVVDDEYDWISQEIGLMVSMVDTGDGGEGLIFGFVAHDQSGEIRDRTNLSIEGKYLFVAVKYNPVVREGSIYMYKEFYALVEAYNKDDLERAKRLMERRERGTEYALPG